MHEYEYYTAPFTILSDTFSIILYIHYFQIYSVFLQSVLLQSVLYNQRLITSAFRSIQYLQGTKKT